ncbi:MAG: HYR domain-containing protein [Verrucomicrobia bacterium]|nr:HYR domain-containing protein [Verrucomicrobiota bacterium]
MKNLTRILSSSFHQARAAWGIATCLLSLTTLPLWAADPDIATQPVSVTVCAGTSNYFAVEASGTAPFTYQWLFNDTNVILNATNPVLPLPNIQVASAGTYTVVISNSVGFIVSTPATLTVNALTANTLAHQTNCPGTTATFTAVTTGAGPFTYTWKKGVDVLQGPDLDNTYIIDPVTTADAGAYTVEITGTCNSVTNTASLVVVGAPTITTQPANQLTSVGNGVVFSVAATTINTVLAPLSYQWQSNGVDIAGATASSLAISNLNSDSTGLFRVVVNNCGGSVTSAAASLTVNPVHGISFDFDTPLQFTNQPYYMTWNNWIDNSFVVPPVAIFESPLGGVGPFPGSGCLDMIPANGTDHTSIILPASFDFSLPGKTLYASTMFKAKTPGNNTRRATQMGFVTATNLGLADQAPQGFMTVIVQSGATTPVNGWNLRTQRRNSSGGLQESTNFVPPLSLTVSNWYRLTTVFSNTVNLAANNFAIIASLQDMGPLGTTPGAVVASFMTTTNNCDIANFRNVYFALRSFEDGGVEARDNTYVWTTPGNLFFVEQPRSQTVLQGRRTQFKAMVDGEGPYSYQWQRDDGGGGFTNIPGARSWNYIVPSVLVSDNLSQYKVVVTGPANTITSDAATLTVTSETLAVVSVGSVDGTTVGVTFSQPVDPATAENVGSYTINGETPVGARVYRTSLGALGPEGIYVLLTPPTVLSGNFTVVVSGVQDLSGGGLGGANSASGTVAGLIGYDVNPLITGPAGENYSFGPGQFIVTGGGSDIYSGGDGFRFVYTTKTGDFDVKVRIPYLDYTRFTAKAGIDARMSLDPYSPGVLVAFDPGPIAEQAGALRQYTEGTAKLTFGAGGTSWGTATRMYLPDLWLRFRRTGNTFMRYNSVDGVNWNFDGQVQPFAAYPAPSTVYLGLAVCAARNLQTMSAQFENYGDFAGYAGAAITISAQPTNIAVNAGSTATIGGLVATASGGGLPVSGELAYVWQREDGAGGWTNMATAGATNNLLAAGTVWATDNGAQYRAILMVPGALSVTSAVATLTVNDTALPTFSSANANLPWGHPVYDVVLNFSEPLTADSVTNLANYVVTNASGTLTVVSAGFLGLDPRTVVLKVSAPLDAGTVGVTVSGLRDLNGNTVAATTRTFRSFAAPTAPVVEEFYTGLIGPDITTHILQANLYTNETPTLVLYSNLFGHNVAINGLTVPSFGAGATSATESNGMRAFSWFVPPTNGAYKFWLRCDDKLQFWMNTNGPDTVIPTTRNSPAAQRAEQAIDKNVNTKYLNFDKLNSGFTLTTFRGTVVTGLRFTTANDAPERDPLSFTLEGTSGDVRTGPWVAIASGSTGLGTDPGRLQTRDADTFVNTTSYIAYRLRFPTVRDAAAANSMQIAEVQFLDAGGTDVSSGPVLIAEVTGASANYTVGSTPANSKTSIALVAGQRYYIEALMMELTGSEGFSVTWTAPTVTTAPANTSFIPPANLVHPAPLDPGVKTITELYIGYEGFLAGYNAYPGLIRATNFPVDNTAFYLPNFNYIAGLPSVVGYQRYFATQPALADTRFNNYLGRMMSYFVPPTNGLYKFYIRSDDASQLWMNTNAVNSTDPAGKVLLGLLPSYTNSGAWALAGQNISLTAGQKYYLEGLWKEGTGGDGMSVAVRSQGDTGTPALTPAVETIPGRLLEFPTPLGRVGAVSFTGILPANPVVAEGQTLTLTVAGLAGSMPYGGYFWYKDGVKVQENSFTNITPPLTMADDNTTYTLVVTNVLGWASRSVTVTVLPDTVAPTVVRSIGWRYNDGFTLEFSEPLEPVSATFLGNYQADNGLKILSATLDPSRTIVSFTTAPQAPGTRYTITLNNVLDASSAANSVAADTTASFSTWAVGGNAILVEVWTNLNGGSIGELTLAPKFQLNLPDLVWYTNVFGVGPFAANSGLEYYGARISGYFVPTNTGLYRFYARSDDASQLWMNINSADSENPAGRTMLIHVPGANQNINAANAQSVPIPLNEGQRYYMEALMKEGTGGDYFQMTFRACDANGVSVTGSPVDNSVTENISTAFFGGAPGTPDMLQVLSPPPASIHVTELDRVTLGLWAFVPSAYKVFPSFQWQKYDPATQSYTNLPGATLTNFTFVAHMSDIDSPLRVAVSLPGNTNTFTTTIQVDPYAFPPQIVSVNSLDGTSITVEYDVTVDPNTATDYLNYDLDYLAGGPGGFDAFNGLLIGDRTIVFPLNSAAYLSASTFHLDAYAIQSGALTPQAGDSSGDGGILHLTPLDIGTPAVGAGGYNPLAIIPLPLNPLSRTNGALDVSANGWDIWGAADGFHFDYRQVSGNFDIKVRVQSLTGADAWSKAGLMARPALTNNSRFILMATTPRTSPIAAQAPVNQFSFQWRDADAAAAAPSLGSLNSTDNPKYPNAWLRLQRVGSVFNGYFSSNAVDWVLLSSRDTSINSGGAFPSTLYLGLATSSHQQTTTPYPQLTLNAFAEYRDITFPLAPKITAQPGPTPVITGIHQSVTFSGVAATSDAPIQYQWLKDGAYLAGQTSASLTIANTAVADSGTYTLIVGNDGGGTLSEPLVLIVTNAPPVIVGETNLLVQNGVLSIPVADLLANDLDPEGDPLSVLAVSGVLPVTFTANFNDGLVPAGSTLYTSAGGGYIGTNGGVGDSACLKLTDNVNSQSGALVINELTPGKRVTAFTASFTLRIGDGTSQPADGFSFNFAPDLVNGVSGGDNGVGTGFSFCLDNYQFVPLAIGSVATAPGGGTANTSGLKINYNNIIIAGVQIPTWNNPRIVPVNITVTVDGIATVFVDGTNVFGNVTLPGYVPKAGRFGFYARTGGQNETHWVDDVSVSVLSTLDTARGYSINRGSLYGSAYITSVPGVANSGTLHLTDAANSQAGSFVLNQLTPGVAVETFNASFKLRIGNGTADAADGFSFNFASDLPDTNAPAAGTSEEGAGTGLSLCIDNYPAAGPGAPAFKVKYGGVELGSVLIPKWNNTNWVPVNVSLAAGGLLTVNVGGTNVVTDLATSYVPTVGRFGFYARTGGQNETHWLDDIVIDVTTAGLPGHYAADFNAGGPGQVTLANGVVTYTPPPDSCGSDQFYYLVSDGQVGGAVWSVKTVQIAEAVPTAPVIAFCVPNTTVAADTNCQALMPDLSSQLAANDNCCCLTVAQNPLAGSPLALGSTTTVTFIVTDTIGLSATCTATVVVADLTAPSIASCPPAQTIYTETSGEAVLPNFASLIEATEACSPPAVIQQSPAVGTLLPVGVTNVTLTVSDALGNAANCVVAVTVVQPINLTLSLTGGSLVIGWPTSIPVVVLQQTTNLTPPVAWSDVVPQPTNNPATLPVPSEPEKYFRLLIP